MQEVLTITQVVTVSNNGYVFLMPYGAPFADIYAALEQLQNDNRAKEASLIEEQAKKKLEEQMKDSVVEASN